MARGTCRESGAEVSDQAQACPRWSGTGFEGKSPRPCQGNPLIHIAYGKDSRDTWRVVKFGT